MTRSGRSSGGSARSRRGPSHRGGARASRSRRASGAWRSSARARPGIWRWPTTRRRRPTPTSRRCWCSTRRSPGPKGWTCGPAFEGRPRSVARGCTAPWSMAVTPLPSAARSSPRRTRFCSWCRRQPGTARRSTCFGMRRSPSSTTFARTAW